MARKLFLRELKQLKTIRKLSASAVKRDVLIKSSIPDLVIPEVNFLEQLWENSHRWDSAHIALKCAETHKSYTYAELWKNISIFGTSLKKKFGLQPNDVVAAMLPNCPEYPVAAFGTLKAGGVMTTINPIYKEFEITHQMSLTNPKIVITIPECYEIVRRGLQNAKNDAKVIILDRTNKPIPEGTIRFSEVAENGESDSALLDKVERKLDDVAFIPFSSGTTGLPKGVEVTHRNLVAANLIMHHERVDDSVIANGSYQEVLPCFLPFFHIYGLVINLIGHVAKGCKLVTMPKFSASTFFNILKNENPTVMYVVPPIVLLLGKHPDVTKDHLKSLRRIICGAAPLSSTDVEGVLEKTEGKLVFGQGYGATETCALASTTFIGRTVLDNSSCGEVMANTEMKFVDPTTGEDLAIGDQGELLIRSPTVMKGYYKNEKATKDSITEDGFFRTGDLGYYKPNVGLYITDRIKELIKVKGMQVAPAELESLLRTHPAVQDAAVIGVPHEYHGEVPKAFIIKKSGQDTTPEQLQDFVARQVAAFKKIEEVVFVNDIPKTNTGKILRKDLKKMYA